MKMPFFKNHPSDRPKRSIWKTIPASLTIFRKTSVELGSFLALLIIYLSSNALIWLSKKRYFPKQLRKVGGAMNKVYLRSIVFLDNRQSSSVSRITLIDLSIRNMKAKKNRTIITVGGMAIGIGITVFLVSIGYGLQELVVSRVARLDEMKQADVTIQPGSKVRINDKTLSDFSNTPNVANALPMIAVVGRVNYKNSVSDVAVYGVTRDYLHQSAIKPVIGTIFNSNDLTMKIDENHGVVAGVSIDLTKPENNVDIEGSSTPINKDKPDNTDGSDVVGAKIQDIEFSFTPGVWSRVRKSPSGDSEIIGYTRRQEGIEKGVEIWGATYPSDDGSGESGRDSEGNQLGKWIKVKVPLWSRETCDKDNPDCADGSHVVKRDDDHLQIQETGYVAELNLNTSGASIKTSQVLGVSTASSEASLGFVEIASESGTIQQTETKKISLGKNAVRQAIVNRAMLKILGIKESESIGKVFSVSFVATGDLLENSGDKIESIPSDYTIIGVASDEKTPIFYVPFLDLRSLGITNYSQVKVVTGNKGNLPQVRKQIEALGFITRSVADTVNQINSLFATARTVLALLGMVALSVAALGMFNTLTVSLLERTREVGLMKAMGMKSDEVKELFLTESMIMGFFGGISGLLIGFLAGKAVGVIISLFAVTQGAGLIDISYIPPLFVVLILFLSLVVGLVTGIYPARHATRISALNALRYE